jgi:hypothetical protein
MFEQDTYRNKDRGIGRWKPRNTLLDPVAAGEDVLLSADNSGRSSASCRRRRDGWSDAVVSWLDEGIFVYLNAPS